VRAAAEAAAPPKQSAATVLNAEPPSAKLATVMSCVSARSMCPGRVGAAERGQRVGAVLLRFMFAEAEQVGEGRQVRRQGR
jgi:hypothetical protein